MSPGKSFSAVLTLKRHPVPIELPPEECTLISVAAAAIVYSCHKFPPGLVWPIGDGIIFGSQTHWKRSVFSQPGRKRERRRKVELFEERKERVAPDAKSKADNAMTQPRAYRMLMDLLSFSSTFIFAS